MPAKNIQAKIFLFHGDDSYSSSAKVRQWADIFIEKHSPQGMVRIDAQQENEKLKDFFSQTKGTSGLFSVKQLVIVKNFFAQKAAETEFLSEWLDDFSEDLFLVFQEETSVKKTLKLYKKLRTLADKGDAKIYEFLIPTGRGLNDFIKKYSKENQINIAPAAQEQLARFMGRDLNESQGFRASEKPAYDLWEVANALDKLATYAQGKTIQKDDISELVSPKVSDNVFQFTEALGSKDAEKARLLFERIFISDTSATEAKGRIIALLGAVSYQFRSLLHLALIKKQGAYASIPGWSPYRMRVSQNLLRNFTANKIKSIIGVLGRIDRQLKSSTLSDKAALAEVFFQIL